LAAALAAGGACATAVGPGAALALADAEGRVVSYVPSITDLRAALDRCPAAVVDLGEVDERPIGAPPRDEQVALLDGRLTELLAVLPGDSTLLVSGLADSSDQPHLGLAMRAGLGTADAGWLTANSTRREGLVQLTDVPSTLLAELGVDQPSAMIGSRWQASGDDRGDVAATVDQLVDDDTKAQVVRDVVGPFFTVLVLGQLVLYVLAALGLRRRWGDESGRRLQVLRVTRATSVVFAAVPVSTFLANLVPWWRTPNPLPVLVLDIALWSAALAAVALLGPWRRALLGPFGVVAGATAGVLALDVLTGSTLQLSSLMGYSPLVAGRFYGFGNAAFALFAASSLLATTAAASLPLSRGRRLAAVVLVCAVGVVAAAIDGWPAWGSDFGGVLALVPGFAVLALGIAQVRISPARFALVLAGSVVVVSAVAILDWLRPSVERSHLGRFVQQVLDGEAVTVIVRKLQANYEILTSNILTLLVPFAVVFVVLVLSRPVEWRAAALQLAYRRSPALRPGLVATLVTVIVGFAVNDSGIVIPAVAATVAVPLTLAVCVTALEREELRASENDHVTHAARETLGMYASGLRAKHGLRDHSERGEEREPEPRTR